MFPAPIRVLVNLAHMEFGGFLTVSRLFEQSKPRKASPRKGQQLPEQVRLSASRPVKLQTVSCWQLEEPSMTGAPARCDVLEGVLSIFTPQDTASPTNPAQLSTPRSPVQTHPASPSQRLHPPPPGRWRTIWRSTCDDDRRPQWTGLYASQGHSSRA
jgi:hypothetical protein